MKKYKGEENIKKTCFLHINRMMNFKIIVTAILVIICMTGCRGEDDTKGQSMIVKYGDDFSGISLVNEHNENIHMGASEKYKLVFVMDSLCGTCKKQLEVVELFKEFYQPYLDVVIIWEDKMPDNNLLNQYNIPKNTNYLLKLDKISIATPTVLIVGKDNKVCFVTTDMDNVALKVNELEGVSIDIVRKNVCKYFNNLNLTDKNTLVYFALQGCIDCEEANKILDKSIEDTFEMIKIYDGGTYGEEKNVDINNIYRSIFDIDWYPSFLVIDNSNNYRFVGKTDIDNLKSTLLN